MPTTHSVNPVLYDHSRGGFISTSTACHGRVIIVCESWPVWLFVLPALRWTCLTVYVTSISPAWLPFLQEMYPGTPFQCNWICSSTMPLLDADWILCHGSLLWLHRHASSWSHKPHLASLSLCSPSSSASSAANLCVSSVAVGSVIAGDWYFQVPADCRHIPDPSMYARCLRHVIDPATRSSARLLRPSVSSLSSDGFLPAHQPHRPVQCNSVFTSTGWLIRPLSVAELGRAFDLPNLLIRSFLTTPCAQLPWLKSPPLKVLLHVGQCVLNTGGGVPDAASLTQPDTAMLTTLGDEGSKPDTARLTSPVNGGGNCVKVAFADGVCFSRKNSGCFRLGDTKAPQSQRAEELSYSVSSGRNKHDNRVGSSSVAASGDLPAETVVGEESLTLSSAADLPAEAILGDDSLTLSPAELEVWQQQFSKSVKADDAATPVHLWDARVWRLRFCAKWLAAFRSRFNQCPLTSLRGLFLLCWRRRVYQSLMSYLRKTYGTKWFAVTGSEIRSDREAGTECLWCAMGADWWEWTHGSRLFFWRWPEAHRLAARDGYPPFVQSELPTYMRPQPFEKDTSIRSKVTEKLQTVRRKQYISKGTVKSLTSFFSVPKGEHDVRMVYDASKLQLNRSLWAPNFGLPTVDSLVRGLNETSWMGDLDIGEMFLNFCLHPDLQPYCGVDIKPYFQHEATPGKTLWERWVRCMMGLKPSPYKCIKALLIAIEIIRGDRRDPKNPFHWESILFNLPGDPGYDPSKPRMSRMRADSLLASLILCYVDDMRAAAAGEDLCWEAMHTFSSKAAYLGIQIATRKTRPPSQSPGPWAGSVVVSQDAGVGVKVSQDKWEKTKAILHHTLDLINSHTPIPLKTLESYRGSLVYVQRT